MKINLFKFAFICNLIFVLFNTNKIYASFFANCELKVKVLGVKPKTDIVKFKVLKIISSGGHVDDYCSGFVGKDFNVHLLKGDFEKPPIKGKNIYIQYEYSDSEENIDGTEIWMRIKIPKK
ncbi:MAG: hypothetical protein KDK36_06550 [Leptospiraceae bacterium]|nr:hypothetical protein [Leptospiraceae bacterium]